MSNSALTLGLILGSTSSLANIAGGYLGVKLHSPEPKRVRQVVAVGAGFLLAAALLDLIPDVGENAPHLLGLVLVGYFVVYALEAAMSRTGTHGHGPSLTEPAAAFEATKVHPGGTLAVGLGLAAHAFFDGVAIVSGFLIGGAGGILLFLTISLHKISVGFSLATLMRSAGFSTGRANSGAVGLALATFLGALVVWLFGTISDTVADVCVALSAGSILYVGASDMIPLTHASEGRVQSVLLTIGASMFFFGSLSLLRSFGLG